MGKSRDWLNNRLIGRTTLEPETVLRIRELLSKPEGWPHTDTMLVGQALERLPLAPIQIVGSASAGPGADSIDEQEPLYVPAHMAREDCRGFIVENDSMLPHLQPGDISIVRQWKVPRLHRVNLIRDGDSHLRLKEVLQRRGRFVAHSYNPDYEDEALQGDIVGYLVGIYRVQGFREEMYFDPQGLEFREVF